MMVRLSRGALFVLCITALIYLPALHGEFLAFDDELLVLDNAKVHGLSFEHVKQAFTTYDPELYVPLTLLTYQIEWSLVGDNPLLYHATNLFLHLVSTYFVFLILRRFFSAPLSIVCALLFSLHPLQVEAVAWVSGRKDLLAAMFFLASVYSYLVWKATGRWRKTVSVLFLFGLLSKVSVFPLPACLLLLDFISGEKLTWRSFTEKRVEFLLASIFVLIAIFGKEVQATAHLLTTVLTAFVSVPLTLLHVVYPVDLTIFYPFTDPVHVLHPKVLVGAAFLSVLAGAAWYVRRSMPIVLFALLWFAVLLAPSLLNVQKGGELGVPDIYLTSDRYAYLALLGPIVLVGSVLKRVRWYWGVLPIAVFAILTYKQIYTWQNSRALFEQVVHVGQPAHVAYMNLGGYVAQEGSLQEAERLYEKALQIRRTTTVLYNLIQVKGVLGKKGEAYALYEEYRKAKPHDQSSHTFLQKFIYNSTAKPRP